MARQKMTTKRKMTPAQKYERLDRRYSDFTAGAISIDHAWLGFMVEQKAKGNSKAMGKQIASKNMMEPIGSR